MPFCPDCGTNLSEDTRFCTECGLPLALGQAVRRTSKKRLVAIIVACVIAIVAVVVIARPAPTVPVEEGWVRLKIPDVGSIDYPPDFLELQSGDYREFVEGVFLVYELQSSDFTLQQVGLNELNLSAFDEYRRVMLQTSYLNPGEEVFRAKQKYTMSKQELAEVRSAWVSQVSQELAQQSMAGVGDNRIVDPGFVEIVEISGMHPLVWTYRRQLDDNPVVLVRQYVFWNYDKIHLLSFSYRVQDEEECTDIYAKILQSFRLQ